MLVLQMVVMLILAAGTHLLIVTMEIHAMLILAMNLLAVLILTLCAPNLMLAIPFVVFQWWDVFKLKLTVMTTTIVPLILVMLRKVVNMKKWFVMITMHARLITAVPLLDAFSFIILLVMMPQLVKIVLVMPKQDAFTRMTLTVAMELVYATPMLAMMRLVAPPRQLTAMTTMPAPPILVVMMKDVYTRQYCAVNLTSAILMDVIMTLVVRKHQLFVMIMICAPLIAATVNLDVPTRQ